MKQLDTIVLLGDSILKGIQVDPETHRYMTKNEMDLPALEQEFGISIQNRSTFGADCFHGEKLLDRMLHRGIAADVIVMDFGGNDCNHKWAEIAAHPEQEHGPNVPLPAFVEQYRHLIQRVKDSGMSPVVTTLPPLIPSRFFNWWCHDLDQDVLHDWLGGEYNIYAHQERYSRAVEQLAREEGIPLIDIRGEFLEHGRIGDLMCIDGTHPNTAGQKCIENAFWKFGRKALYQAHAS